MTDPRTYPTAEQLDRLRRRLHLTLDMVEGRPGSFYREAIWADLADACAEVLGSLAPRLLDPAEVPALRETAPKAAR